jgi:DNA damage-binding protein 1
VIHGQVVQVTRSELRLIDASPGQLVADWRPDVGVQINVATGNPSQLLVATGDGTLTYFEVQQRALCKVHSITLLAEISCMDISPAGAGAGPFFLFSTLAGLCCGLIFIPNALPFFLGDGVGRDVLGRREFKLYYSNPLILLSCLVDEISTSSSIAAVGTWNMEVLIYAVPSLSLLTSEPLGGEVIPRSVLFASFEGLPYLLCAMGDGRLFNFHIDTATGEC